MPTKTTLRSTEETGSQRNRRDSGNYLLTNNVPFSILASIHKNPTTFKKVIPILHILCPVMIVKKMFEPKEMIC